MKKQVFALFLFVFFLFAITTSFAFASPIVNEFSSATSADWVEIYNPGADTVDLSQYRLRDLTSTNKLDLSGSLAPSGFVGFDWSNKLNNAGDLIKLVLISDESIIDQVTYGDQGGISAPASTQTGGRKSDGAAEWVILSASSKGFSNNSSSVFSPPTATPTKTPTPTPIKIPTAVKTATAQKISPTSRPPTPTVQASTNSSVSNKITPKSNNSAKIAHNSKIASDFASIRNITPTSKGKQSSVQVLGTKDQSFSPLFLLGGVVLLLAGCIWFVLKNYNISEIYEKIFNKH